MMIVMIVVSDDGFSDMMMFLMLVLVFDIREDIEFQPMPILNSDDYCGCDDVYDDEF